MSEARVSAEELTKHVLAAPRSSRRRLVALAGPPGSGKSTLAAQLGSALNAADCPAQVVPMDGFHLDNRVLSARGILHRKGAPETFDVGGFGRLIRALTSEDSVVYPIFDRDRDIAVAGAGVVSPMIDTVIVEGNYLLYDAPGWRDLSTHWDVSIYLQVPNQTLETRLIERWQTLGIDARGARLRVEENDLANAAVINSNRLPSDLTVGA